MHWGPRTIDLDILFYDREVIDTENLHIPHIDMANRLFVLTPLAEIAPFYRHPISQITVDEMLQNLQKSIKDQK
jgi:dihydroneopterin aldolase/2-amino-4-hydroxy-6-hydroxymethyldihydropteridine diphosphokinase